MRKVLIKGRGYSLLWAVQVCATPKGLVFSRFGYKYRIDFGYFVFNRVWFLHFSLKLGMFFRKSDFSIVIIIITKAKNKSPLKIMVRATVLATRVINIGD